MVVAAGRVVDAECRIAAKVRTAQEHHATEVVARRRRGLGVVVGDRLLVANPVEQDVPGVERVVGVERVAILGRDATVRVVGPRRLAEIDRAVDRRDRVDEAARRIADAGPLRGVDGVDLLLDPSAIAIGHLLPLGHHIARVERLDLDQQAVVRVRVLLAIAARGRVAVIAPLGLREPSAGVVLVDQARAIGARELGEPQRGVAKVAGDEIRAVRGAVDLPGHRLPPLR